MTRRERARLERGDAFGELVALAASNGVVVERTRGRADGRGGDVRTDGDDGGERGDGAGEPSRGCRRG